MNHERWRQIEHVCLAALQRESHQRAAFLDDACAGDSKLRDEVEALLACQPEAGAFLETAAARAAEAPDNSASRRDVLTPGTQLGPYRIVELAGAGGMGQVYKAVDSRLNRAVAIKLLPADLAADPEFQQRFDHEAHAVAALNHPNILTVHDVGSWAGTPYLVSELLEGETLRDLMSRCAMTQRQVLSLAVQIARGLDGAHSRGVIHGDLKPENLVVTTDGHVKILDFGLARFASHPSLEFEPAPSTVGIRSTKILGTIGYIAPEQLRALPADHRSDIFSFGTVLFEMLARKSPFIRDNARATLTAVLEEEADLSSLCHATPALTGIVRRCLEKSPEDRFQSARDLTVALETVLGGPAIPAPLERFETHSPYPGLSSFTEQDAPFFFGREEEIAALWERLRETAMVAVIGPSGVGKTSFVRAGLLASRPEEWEAIVCTPGVAPLRALGQALAPELTGDADALRKLLAFEDPGVAFELVKLWRTRHGEALLVVDQFEELFTLHAPEVQERFAALLGRLAHEGDVHVLLSMRDDFLMRCAAHEALASIFHALIPLTALGPRELRRALVEPARRQGYEFEDEALVEEMVGSVASARAALPLLAFAVSRLWDKRDRARKVLTRQASEEIGGVAGALAQHAEATLDRIGTERQGIVREIFRLLVTSQGTRVAADRDELLSAFTERNAAQAVLETLIDARLLTSFVDENETSTKPARHRLEIAHESLLEAWPRLVRWRAQDEDGALLRDQLRQAAHLWEHKARRPEFLWTGTAYEEFRLWRQRYSGGLTALEEDFARAMSARARRKRRFTRIAVGGAFVLLSATAIAIGMSRQQAITARDEAEASRLLALAELRFVEDPTEALAFTIASLEQADSPEARVFAMKVLWEAPPAVDLIVGSEAARMPAFSPDGKRLAAAGHADRAMVWSEDGGGPVVLPGLVVSPAGPSLALWPSNDLIVTGLSAPGRRVQLWTPDGTPLRTIDFERPSFWQVARGRLFAEILDSGVATHLTTGLLRSWVLPDGEPVDLGRVDWRGMGPELFTVFAPDGRSWLYKKGLDLYARPLPVGSGVDRRLARFTAGFRFASVTKDQLIVRENSGQSHEWSFHPADTVVKRSIARAEAAPSGRTPDFTGRWLRGNPATERRVHIWDSAWSAARPLSLRRSGQWYAAAAGFHPTGNWVVASTNRMSRLTFWPLARTYPHVVEGYSTLSRPVMFSPDGKWFATSWETAEGTELRLWPLPGSGRTEARTLPLPERFQLAGLAFDPGGRYLFAVGTAVWIVPLDGSAPRKLQGVSENTFLAAAAVSPSGRQVATAFHYGSEEKTLRVWNLQTGALRRFNLPEHREAAGTGTLGRTGYEQGIPNLEFASESVLYSIGDGGIRRWNLDTGSHEVLAESSPGYRMKGSFDAGRRVSFTVEVQLGRGATCRDPRVRDLTSGTSRPITRFGECASWSNGNIALDPSGTVGAVGSSDGVVRVGRLDREEPHLLIGHTGATSRISISPDRRWVATTGEDNTLRLWPMPDLSKTPLHTLPHGELLSKLRSLTNLRVVRDPSSAAGWKVEVGPFPGWKHVPTW